MVYYIKWLVIGYIIISFFLYSMNLFFSFELCYKVNVVDLLK